MTAVSTAVPQKHRMKELTQTKRIVVTKTAHSPLGQSTTFNANPSSSPGNGDLQDKLLDMHN